MQKREILKSAKVNEIYRKKRSARAKKAFVFLLLIIAGFVGLGFLSKLNKFTINGIKVTGVSVLSEDDIKRAVINEIEGNYLFIFSKKNSFIYPKNKIESFLSNNFKRISSISVHKENLKTLVVDIKEHSGKYMFCDAPQEEKEQENCFFIDDTGYVFAEAPHFSGNIYFRFYNFGTSTPSDFFGKNFLDKNEFRKFIQFKELLEKNNSNPVWFVLRDKNIAEMVMEGESNSKIIFKRTANVEKIFSNFVTAIDTEPLKTMYQNNFDKLLYIDLRFDNKVYYKFK